jgi:hypothetical protein
MIRSSLKGSTSFTERLSEDFFATVRTENRRSCYRIETQIARKMVIFLNES